MNEDTTFETVKNTYFDLDKNFEKLFLLCTTDDQRRTLRFDYTVARDNFYNARNKIFHDQDPAVVDVTKQLQDINKQIAHQLVELKDLVSLLASITAAVNLASRAVALAAVL